MINSKIYLQIFIQIHRARHDIRAESLWSNDRVLQWGDLYAYVSGGFGRVSDRVVGVKHMVQSGNVTDLEGGAQPNTSYSRTNTHQHAPAHTNTHHKKAMQTPNHTQYTEHKCEETDSIFATRVRITLNLDAM